MSYHNEDRNPLILPDREPLSRARCPKCGASNFVGRRVQGQVTFTCRQPSCDGKWFGGLPQEPQDPRLPTPPVNPADLPPVDFGKDSKGQPVEIRRRVNYTQQFRKGAPIPEGEK